MMQRHRYQHTTLGILTVVGLLGLTGCYSRTIESKGLGSRFEQRDIYKPNVETQRPQEAKKKKSGGFFNNIGEFFFGSEEETGIQ